MYSLYLGSKRTFKPGREVSRAGTCTSIKQPFEFTGASSGWCTDQGTDASGFVMLMSENIIMSHEISDKNSHCPFVSGLCMRNKIPKSNFGQTYNWEINWFEIAPAFETSHFILLPVNWLNRKSLYDPVLPPSGRQSMDQQWKRVFQFQYRLSLKQTKNKRNGSSANYSHFKAEYEVIYRGHKLEQFSKISTFPWFFGLFEQLLYHTIEHLRGQIN